MVILMPLLLAFGGVSASIGLVGGYELLSFVGVAAWLAALAIWLSRPTSAFLKILVATFAVETVGIGTLGGATAVGLLPADLAWLKVPDTLVATLAVFTAAATFAGKIPAVRRTLAIADRYFVTTDRLRIGPIRFPERGVAASLLIVVVLLSQLQVFFSVNLAFASSAIAEAMQTYDGERFWKALLYEFPLYLAPLLIALAVEFIARSVLAIRWRLWLSRAYMRQWLISGAHYRMALANAGADNPDQRIQEDVARFVDSDSEGSGVGVLSFVILLIGRFGSLVSYSVILWRLSSKLADQGSIYAIPGFLFWCALFYALTGTMIARSLGRPLAALAFARQHYEADFRFALARLRDNSEQIALLSGEKTETHILLARFSSIVRNFYALTSTKVVLRLFTNFFENVNYFIPYLILGALFFTRHLGMGDLTQVTFSFISVNAALTFFITFYPQLAELKSVLDRLTSFDTGIAAVSAPPCGSVERVGTDFLLSRVQIELPGGDVLSEPIELQLQAGQNVLVTGPSGTGKSTLFRVLAGIWPHWSGHMSMPAAASVMVLPQKPYLPIGSLLAIVSYPRPAGTYSRSAILQALHQVGLSGVATELDIDDNWAQRLSGGEQQRLAIARAILAKPDWLLLDEATAAMDAALESTIYELLAESAASTTIVSIAHRESLARFHNRRINVRLSGAGRFELHDAPICSVLDSPAARTAGSNQPQRRSA